MSRQSDGMTRAGKPTRELTLHYCSRPDGHAPRDCPDYKPTAQDTPREDDYGYDDPCDGCGSVTEAHEKTCPTITPRVVAECWTCSGYHTIEDERAGLRKPMPLPRCGCFDAIPAGCEGFVHKPKCEGPNTHMAAGHDVREVSR